MKRKDLIFLALILIVIGGVYLFGKHAGFALPTGGGFPKAASKTAGAEPADRASASPSAQPTLVPADAYLSLQVGRVVYDPIPLTGETDIPIVQDKKKNVVHVTRASIAMLSSTCQNQECVHQGTVTLKNRASRILSNMIICLPNQVTLSLLTPEEARQQWADTYGKKP